VTFKAGQTVLDETEVDAYLLDAHLTVRSIMYNSLSVSGGVRWWNPATGHAIAKPRYTVDVIDTDAAYLEPGELCTCEDVCMKESV